jgi:hypothetical protein
MKEERLSDSIMYVKGKYYLFIGKALLPEAHGVHDMTLFASIEAANRYFDARFPLTYKISLPYTPAVEKGIYINKMS